MYILYNLIIFTIFLLCFTIFLRINNKFNYYFTILLPSFTRFLLGFTMFLLYSFFQSGRIAFGLKNIYIYLLCFYFLIGRSGTPNKTNLLRNYYEFNVYLLHFLLCFYYVFTIFFLHLLRFYYDFTRCLW